jgi:hypothetical protein
MANRKILSTVNWHEWVIKYFPKTTINIMNKLYKQLQIYCYNSYGYDSDDNYYEKLFTFHKVLMMRANQSPDDGRKATTSSELCSDIMALP